MAALRPSNDASPGRRRDIGLGDDPISPELALVDPDLAARARADLPWPEPTLPRRRREAEVVPVAPIPAAAEPVRAPPEPLHFGRRLVAAATLVPALVTLALIAEFLGRSASPLGATTTTMSSPTTTRHAATTPTPTATTTTRSRPSTARPPRSRTRKRVERRSLRPVHRTEGLIAQMGNTPGGSTRARGAPTSRRRKGQYCSVRWAGEGLTLVYVARVPRNPCTDGRVVGGYVTGRSWRTAAGLSIGSSLSRLRRLYPGAAPTGSGWWKLGTIRRGNARRIPLHAHVTDGRVDKILVN